MGGGGGGNVPKIPKKIITRATVYAPPRIWGAWYNLCSYNISTTFDIEVEAIGDADVKGQVRYWKYNANKKMQVQVTEEFFDSTTIRTADDVWAILEIRLKGTLLGTTCYVTVIH